MAYPRPRTREHPPHSHPNHYPRSPPYRESHLSGVRSLLPLSKRISNRSKGIVPWAAGSYSMRELSDPGRVGPFSTRELFRREEGGGSRPGGPKGG